jgi:hypothetical protein
MNAVLAIIADSGRAILVIYREGSRNKLISPLLYSFIFNTLMAASSNPFRIGSRGGVFSFIKTMALEGKTAPSWWWCLYACV